MTQTPAEKGGRERLATPDGQLEAGFEQALALAGRLFAAPAAELRLSDAPVPRAKDPAGPFFAASLAADCVLLVPDAADDPRFASVAAVKAGRIRFFAAAPLTASDGRRLGTLAVMDADPRLGLGADAAGALSEFARLVAAGIELRVARRRFAEELASRRLAEHRLKLANDITLAALEAPDFRTAMTVCLKLVANEIGADCAFARGLSPRSGELEVEADYLAPASADLAPLHDYFRCHPVTRGTSIVAQTIFERRPLVLLDLAKVDGRPYPLMAAVREYGLRSMISVPCEDAGSRYSLTFLFRQPPADIEALAETVNSVTGRVRDLLARKQSEQRIALLQSVALHTGDAVIISEEAPRPGELPTIVYVNPAFTVLTGFAAEEVVGQPATLLRGSKSEIVTLERIRAAIMRRETIGVEMHLHRKDATAFWAEIDVTPVEDSAGLTRHWIAIVRDRTGQRASEEALRVSERKLRRLAERQTAVLDALPARVALLDGDGHIVSVSRSWGEFARGVGIEESGVGANYFEFLERSCAEEHAEAMAQGVAAVLAGRERTFSGDYLCDQRNGRRWYRLMIAPMTLDAGAGAVAMHLDVTTSRQAEEGLRREKEFSEFLVKSTTEGILVFNRDFRITLWNPGIEAITGIAPDQALGRDAFQLLPFLAGTAGEEAMRGALEGREASFFDQRYALTVTSRHGFYEAYFSPLVGSGRTIMGGIGFLRETTERRRIEDALRQSQKMEAVGQLTGGIAHDFNNMLTVIAGNLELLEGKLAGESRLLRLVNSASLAASRAEKLTQQLLTFSRRQQLRPQPVDFNQIVIGMSDLLHRTVGEAIEIRTALSADLWAAFADPNQLETALLNLVLNARDAMPGGGCILLETSNIDFGRGDHEIAPGPYAVLSIGDTGTGMSEEVLAHVFEPFFTTKEVGKGTGLGLSQVYGFINQSHGYVRIESREGSGTTVRLYMPRAEGAAVAGTVSPMREARYRGTETVLVVEDDHGVRDFAVSVLRELGYRVVEAANGDRALEIIGLDQTIDLLFTDVVMPGHLNGVDLAHAACAAHTRLRVLFTSGYTTRLVEKEWSSDAIALLRKPYGSVDLAERVRAVLDRAVAAAE